MSESRTPQGGAAPQRPGGMGGPGMMGRGPAEKPKDFKKTMKTLVTYLSPYKVTIIAVMLIAVVSTVFSIVGPKLLGKVTTKLSRVCLPMLPVRDSIRTLPIWAKSSHG